MEKRGLLQSSDSRRLAPVLFFACLIGAAAFVATTTQGQQGPPAKNPTGAKQARQTTGWLILDGALIPGPYEVEAGESTISVNGVVAVARPPRNKPSPSTTPTSSTHAANRALYDTFLVWYAMHGIDSARQRALDFISVHELVDTAYLEGIKLQVKYKTEDTFEGFLLSPPEDDHESTEQVLRENLAMLAARLQMHLTSGSLVFLKRSGGYHAIPSPRAAEVLNQLLELARAELSIDARMVAIRKLIGDEEMAKAIARSLGK